MATPFATLEARANSAVFSRLANAIATLMPGGQIVQGIYEAPYTVGLLIGPGVAGELPQYTLPTASVPDDWEGKPLVITQGMGVGNYTVRGHMPDGLGISVLSLEMTA